MSVKIQRLANSFNLNLANGSYSSCVRGHY